MNYAARSGFGILYLVAMFGVSGCTTNQIMQPAPTGQKAQLAQEIASSVANPKTTTMHQNNFGEAVNSLLTSAKTQQETANYAAAAASIERALRINPKSTQAYYRLAEVRLEQERFGEAEQLAKKALSYVNFGDRTKNNDFKAGLWHLISVARSRANNKVGAEKALIEAHKFESRML